MSDVEAVRALMEADRWIDRVSSQRNHLPEMAELATIEAELRALLSALNEAQSALAPVRTAYDDAVRDAERLRTRSRDLEATLSSSTANARELSALQRELEHVRELLSQAEDRELEYMIEVEPMEQLVVDIKEKAQPGVARRGELQRSVAELQATLDEEIRSLRDDRAQRADAVSRELLARYDHALVRSGGSGAALVDAGRCDGCRIALSPLDVDRWKHMPEGSLMDCPECGRLLLA